MPNVSEKKLKLLYLAQMLLEKTDGQHAITLPQMLAELESKGIPAERKSLYDDLETLRRFGFAIETRKSRCFEYYLAQRPFSQEDLTQLAQAVRQAPFLTQRFSEIHLFDLRYNKTSLKDYIAQNDIDSVLVLYNFSNFVTDQNLLYLAR